MEFLILFYLITVEVVLRLLVLIRLDKLLNILVHFLLVSIHIEVIVCFASVFGKDVVKSLFIIIKYLLKQVAFISTLHLTTNLSYLLYLCLLYLLL